jgi:AraC-like DNA-binding protein
MDAVTARLPTAFRLRELARQGDMRRAALEAREALKRLGSRGSARERVDLHIVAASCAMRQGAHGEARRDLDAAARIAEKTRTRAPALRVRAWRAELAYLQGQRSDADPDLEQLSAELERAGDLAYAAFALRVRLASLLARADYAATAAISQRALRLAQASGDDYVLVQVLNVMGATCFDRATSRLGQPHARAHLPLVDPVDATHVADDAHEALRLFEQARDVALRGRYPFAAWYVAGNIERLEILLGRAARIVPAIRKRLAALQARGATYDEIVTRSNLAWALRTLGRHREALHELDVALDLARETGTANVILEFIHYDRAVVLHALGEHAAAHASYRQYHRRAAKASAGEPVGGSTFPPLEPFFLKRADRFILAHIDKAIRIDRLAEHCCVSWRTLQAAFKSFRGLTPVAHIRNLRLDHAHRALSGEGQGVADIARRFGFGSVTTFAREYRKRFGMAPSRTGQRGEIPADSDSFAPRAAGGRAECAQFPVGEEP